MQAVAVNEIAVEPLAAHQQCEVQAGTETAEDNALRAMEKIRLETVDAQAKAEQQEAAEKRCLVDGQQPATEAILLLEGEIVCLQLGGDLGADDSAFADEQLVRKDLDEVAGEIAGDGDGVGAGVELGGATVAVEFFVARNDRWRVVEAAFGVDIAVGNGAGQCFGAVEFVAGRIERTRDASVKQA